MPNVHIRDVPIDALAVLRAAAERRGRSLNAELVAVLVASAEREELEADFDRRLDGVRRRWKARNPDGFPAGLEPETVIREAREAR